MGRKGKMPKPGDRRAGRMEGSSAPGQDLAMPVSTANAGLEVSEERRLSGAPPSSEPHLTAAQGDTAQGTPLPTWAETGGANPQAESGHAYDLLKTLLPSLASAVSCRLATESAPADFIARTCRAPERGLARRSRRGSCR